MQVSLVDRIDGCLGTFVKQPARFGHPNLAGGALYQFGGYLCFEGGDVFAYHHIRQVQFGSGSSQTLVFDHGHKHFHGFDGVHCEYLVNKE